MARLTGWARRLKAEVLALWIAARSPDTPWLARGVAALVALYAFSPIDLIPDAIPVLGLLDDLILLPLGIALAVRLIPSPLLARFRAEGAQLARRPVSRLGALVIGTLWLVLLAGLVWLARDRLRTG